MRQFRRAWRVLPLVAVSALVLAGVVLLHPGSSGATAITHTISFTGDGPSPSSLQVTDGDSIRFSNDVDPSSGMAVVGTLTGAVSSVSVTISGATVGSFTLGAGQSAVVGPYHAGSAARTVSYTVTYSPRYLIGLLPGPSRTVGGAFTIEPPAH